MIKAWETTQLGGWAANRSPAQVVDLGSHRSASARWQLEISPRAIGAIEIFDRLIGLKPTPSLAHLPEDRPRRRA